MPIPGALGRPTANDLKIAALLLGMLLVGMIIFR